MRVPVVLVAIALLMSLSGCVPGVDTTTPPSTSVGQGVETTSSDSSGGLLTNDAVPSNLRSSLEDSRPILVFFYDGSAVSQEDKQIIDALLAENIGLVDSHFYDIESTGTVDLAGLLGVSEVPAVVLIDRSGEVSYLRSGLVDQEFLSREIFSAAK